MTPIYLNSSPSQQPYPPVDHQQDHDQHRQFFTSNHQAAATSSSLSCHIFFSSGQDQTGFSHGEVYQPQQLLQQEGNNYELHGGSHEEEDDDPDNRVDSSLKLSLWKKEDRYDNIIQGKQHGHGYDNINLQEAQKNPVKWMSSKMRVMQKMKKADHRVTTMEKFEDHKQPSSSSIETDYSSNGSSNNCNTTPIRVCSDCNTTKTPLWRSGPKGPKSLCNACGIRQRKARRAMAAAAAAANGTVQTAETSSSMKIKVQHSREKTKSNGHSAHYKKRSKVAAAAAQGGPSNQVEKKKTGFEDFLVKLSKNLAFQRVFPQDEKEAAILLMALSCGLVHS